MNTGKTNWRNKKRRKLNLHWKFNLNYSTGNIYKVHVTGKRWMTLRQNDISSLVFNYKSYKRGKSDPCSITIHHRATVDGFLETCVRLVHCEKLLMRKEHGQKRAFNKMIRFGEFNCTRVRYRVNLHENLCKKLPLIFYTL